MLTGLIAKIARIERPKSNNKSIYALVFTHTDAISGTTIYCMIFDCTRVQCTAFRLHSAFVHTCQYVWCSDYMINCKNQNNNQQKLQWKKSTRGSDTPSNHKCMNSFNGKFAIHFEIDCSDARKMCRNENGDYYKHQQKRNFECLQWMH